MTREEIKKKAYVIYPKMSRISEWQGTKAVIKDNNEEKREGFCVGYKQATEDFVKKSCEWLNNHLDCMASMTPEGELYWLNCIDNFRKAMEE